ncbi:MAG: UDP-N-acetylmuramate--L-alanine ligase [Ignavibacteria bacterium]|nr:UDP-N-acetylmuramate--L-alanine ligase [Ignavibacteria bacterium]
MFTTVTNIHFVGIGGIGMSGIAEILVSQGFTVSGSDAVQSESTDYLATIGAKIIIGHAPSNIDSAEVVVYSSAVNVLENPETLEAINRKIPLIRRAEMLAEVARLNYCLAIAGTHGKTTTTSMCGLVLMKAGIDPTVLVGGRLRGLGGTNARLGKGKWTVVEADEYDRSFLQLSPTIAIINNVEAEHLDIYGSLDEVKNAFVEFANKTPFYGFTAVGLDDTGVKDILPRITKKIVTYGISPHADIRATNITAENRSTHCTVIANDIPLGELTINIPGIHNIKNALAAVTVGLQLGIEYDVIRQAIAEFSGVYRRFEIKGEFDGVLIVDDYAHHPTEVRATLSAARAGWKDRRIVCVFQPHTYTRTRDFLKEFGQSFDDADVLVVLDIYAAREKPIEGLTGESIAKAARQSGHKNVRYCQSKEEATEFLQTFVREGDLLLTLGAGDVWKITNHLMN